MLTLRLLSAAAVLSMFAGSTLAQPEEASGRAVAVGAPALEAAGSVREVTVYRGQALVTRVLAVQGAPGLREVIVTGLPESILAGSLYAEGEGLEVRSVLFRVRPAAVDAREQVRQLEDKMRALGDQINALESQKAVDEAHRQYLDRLEQFTAPTAQAELRSGVLNAETLKALADFAFQKREDLARRAQERSIQMRDRQEQLALLQREMRTLTAGASRSEREAVLFVNQTGAQGALRLKYLVGNATWQPSYNLRADASKGVVGVEYQAQVRQMSGEDWSGVRMTLSTATPALVAAGPRLEPMTLVLAGGEGDKAKAWRDRGYDDLKKEMEQRQMAAAYTRNLAAAQTPAPDARGAESQTFRDFDKSLNDLAKDAQLLDLVTTAELNRKGAREPVAPGDAEVVSVTYVIATPTSLPSRSDEQLIQIARGEAPAKFARVATPALTEYVYTQAAVTNTLSAGGQDLVLLAGPANAYLGEQFVGRDTLPTISAGEVFTAGFGIDTSLRARRELVERSEAVQGGNRVMDFTYRLTIENFSGAPATVRLLDRMPVSKTGDIKITMSPPSGNSQPLSTDGQYLKNERKQGLLRWDLTVPAGAGPQAFSVEYAFRVEHDKLMNLGEVGG